MEQWRRRRRLELVRQRVANGDSDTVLGPSQCLLQCQVYHYIYFFYYFAVCFAVHTVPSVSRHVQSLYFEFLEHFARELLVQHFSVNQKTPTQTLSISLLIITID